MREIINFNTKWAFSKEATAVPIAVAVSAKAQEALDLSYSTMFEDEIVEGEIYISMLGVLIRIWKKPKIIIYNQYRKAIPLLDLIWETYMLMN